MSSKSHIELNADIEIFSDCNERRFEVLYIWAGHVDTITYEFGELSFTIIGGSEAAKNFNILSMIKISIQTPNQIDGSFLCCSLEGADFDPYKNTAELIVRGVNKNNVTTKVLINDFTALCKGERIPSLYGWFTVVIDDTESLKEFNEIKNNYLKEIQQRAGF